MCVIGVATAQENFKDCLQQDSISCVQLAVRQMDYLFVIKWLLNFRSAKPKVTKPKCEELKKRRKNIERNKNV